MVASETVFEYLAMAREATKGTAVTPPTHYLPFSGIVKPMQDFYYATDSNGLLAEFSRSQAVRKWSEWSGDGGADPNYAPLLFNLVVRGAVTAPTTPTNGILTRLWTFTPAMTSDVLDSGTFYWGDPAVQIWQAVYCMAEEMTIAADASGTDAATWTVKGFGKFPTEVAAPTLPAQNIGDLVMPGSMQLWLDATTIGTTEVTGRFISTDWTIPTGVTRKHYAGGVAGNLDYTKHGRKKRSAKAKITVELNDVSVGAGKEYLTYKAGTLVKMRIRLNGAQIEAVTPTYYSYIELDIYGRLASFDWGTVEDSNRTMTFEVTSQYDSTAATDFLLRAQNTRTAL